MATSDNYAERFKSLRRRELLAIGLFLGYLPIVGALAWLVSRVTPSESPAMVLALAWMLAFALAGLRVSLFRCPRCAKRFYMNKYLVTTLGRKCPHCGLRRYAKA